jgi:hypothetical protein
MVDHTHSQGLGTARGHLRQQFWPFFGVANSRHTGKNELTFDERE